MSIRIHPVKWSTENIHRLWNYYGSNPAYEAAYFARNNGHRILSEIDQIIGVSGDVLDLGCGPGYLLSHLKALTGWSSYTGVDSSVDSLMNVKAMAAGAEQKVDAITVKQTSGLSDASVDRVFCIEMVEHCEDAVLVDMLKTIRRLLKKDGYMVVTTPNAEDLDRSMHICPECACVYHKWQHIRSWTMDSLSGLMVSNGFAVQQVFTCDFSRDDLGRRPLDKVVAMCQRRSRWRTKFEDLPHMMLIVSPTEQKDS